jgi:hypothetical protein
MNIQRQEETEFVETFDATEHLLEQIEQLDSTSDVSQEDVSQEETAPVAPAAYDPFQEAFGSEEVVLDQYLAFECELLATAPRVINRLDTAFAYQLGEFAIQDVSTDSTGTAASTTTTTTELDPEEGVETLAADSHAERDPGEVLVIEEEGRAHVNLVAGRQFRQLFSSLQSQSRTG